MKQGFEDGYFVGSLGTFFQYDSRRDSFSITSPEGLDLEVPGPDLRELLQALDHQLTPAARYDEAFDRTMDRLARQQAQIEQEREQAPTLLAELLSTSEAERSRWVAERAEYQTHELAVLALSRSRGAVHDDAAKAKELAEVGRLVAQAIREESYGVQRVLALRAYSEAVFGNSLRVAGDLRGAAASFRSARSIIERAELTDADVMEIDALEVSLRRDLRDFQGALALSVRAIDSFRAAGMTVAAVKALLTRATVFEILGDQVRNLETLREATRSLGASDDPWTALFVRHNLLVALARGGQTAEAERVFQETHGLYQQFAIPATVARRHWAEGLIHLGRHRPREASASLERARDIFTANGFFFDSALVSLDLGCALAEKRDLAALRQVAAAAYGLLEAQGVHPDALAALAQFQKACRHESVSRELVIDLARRIKRAAEIKPLPA